jgi:hypothetical protein
MRGVATAGPVRRSHNLAASCGLPTRDCLVLSTCSSLCRPFLCFFLPVSGDAAPEELEGRCRLLDRVASEVARLQFYVAKGEVRGPRGRGSLGAVLPRKGEVLGPWGVFLRRVALCKGSCPVSEGQGARHLRSSVAVGSLCVHVAAD